MKKERYLWSTVQRAVGGVEELQTCLQALVEPRLHFLIHRNYGIDGGYSVTTKLLQNDWSSGGDPEFAEVGERKYVIHSPPDFIIEEPHAIDVSEIHGIKGANSAFRAIDLVEGFTPDEWYAEVYKLLENTYRGLEKEIETCSAHHIWIEEFVKGKESSE